METVKVVFRIKVIALNAHIRKGGSKINNLTVHFKKKEKEEHIKCEVKRRK